MNLFQRAVNIARGEQRSATEPNDIAIYGNNQTLSLLFGGIKGDRPAMTLSAVYSAIELISNSIAQIPIVVKSVKADGTKDIDFQHPINYAFNDNKWISRFTMIKNCMRDLFLYGNGYIHINRSNGVILGLRYIPCGKVTIFYNEQSGEFYYTSSLVKNKDGKIDPHDMLHFVKNTRSTGIMGVGILSYADKTIKLAGKVEKSAENYFNSGCHISGVIKSSTPMNDKQREDLRTSWRQTYGEGANDNGGLVVLPPNQDYNPIGSNPQEAQMLESRRFSVEEIARFFNISPILLGDLASGSISSWETANLQLLTHCLQPIMVMMENEMNRKLLREDERGIYVIDMDEKAFLRTDSQSTANYYSTLVGGGILSINEARHALGYGSIDGGDSVRIPFSDAAQNEISSNKSAEQEETEEEKPQDSSTIE